MNISKKKAIKLLEEIFEIANQATLIGSLKQGIQPLESTYNKIRELSIKNGWADEDLFEVLPIVTEDKIKIANVGTAAKLLAAMLEDDEVEEPEKYDENGYEIVIKS